MRVLEGVGTLVQLAGLIARLCKLVCLLSRYGVLYADQLILS